MKFCPECSNILYPRDDKENRVLLYACRQCDYTEEADDSERTMMVFDVIDDPTFPRVGVTCPECGHNEAVFFQAPTTDENEGMTLMYVCRNHACKHKWKE